MCGGLRRRLGSIPAVRLRRDLMESRRSSGRLRVAEGALLPIIRLHPHRRFFCAGEGEKSKMLRDLREGSGDRVGGNGPCYWNWVSHTDSRFAEVTELSAVCYLDICVRIDCRELSPKTTYKAYLIFKLAPALHGLKYPAQQVSVSLGAQISKQQASLHPDEKEVWELHLQCGHDVPPDLQAPHTWIDRWLELEMGEFFNEDGGDGEVSMSCREVKATSWKCGLVIKGIQVRPE